MAALCLSSDFHRLGMNESFGNEGVKEIASVLNTMPNLKGLESVHHVMALTTKQAKRQRNYQRWNAVFGHSIDRKLFPN